MLNPKFEKICVSIFILTYNQEEFIAQTIEGVLMQETNFSFQLVIGEDQSQDRTREICESYAAKYKNQIKLLDSDKNYGLIKNFIRTLKECSGDFIAVCDGDDYWTDPQKLQKQIDFLNDNPEYDIVYTGIKNLYPSGEFKIKSWPEIKTPKSFDELIFGNFIPSVTVVYRNLQKEEDFPSWIEKFPYGDWPIYLWTTKKGSKIGYIDEITAVYRKEIGVSEKMKKRPSEIANVNLGIVQCVFYDPRFEKRKKLIKKSLIKHRFGLMAIYFREGQLKKSFILALKLFISHPLKVVRTYIYIIRRSFLIKGYFNLKTKKMKNINS